MGQFIIGDGLQPKVVHTALELASYEKILTAEDGMTGKPAQHPQSAPESGSCRLIRQEIPTKILQGRHPRLFVLRLRRRAKRHLREGAERIHHLWRKRLV